MAETFAKIVPDLVAIASSFHARGWMMGTSGNLSAVVNREPLSLAMSPSGLAVDLIAFIRFLLGGEGFSS